ncbi:hypothetical protein ANN_03239 [Periplaneta americana]|uniref:Uncharacterized protein n=1 Tax=Periplaneta americana TaxID=6978 RepID=A0ABQ8TYI9_PERAM|nr:hypothetical protein ANN_03239 [Periplaneta americana]
MSPGSSICSYWVEGKPRKKPQPDNLPRPGIKPGPPGFAARRANRYSTALNAPRRLRLHCGRSLRQVARELEVSPSVVSRLRNRHRETARLMFAENHTDWNLNQWQFVLFSDESSVSAHVAGIVTIVKDELKADFDKLKENFANVNTAVAGLRQDVDHFEGKIRALENRQEQTSELLDKNAEENKHTLALMDQLAEENKHILALVDRQAREQKQIIAQEVRRAMEKSTTELRTPYSGSVEPTPPARHSYVKTPKFDGMTCWKIFRRQFEAIAEHNWWTPAEKLLSC